MAMPPFTPWIKAVSAQVIETHQDEITNVVPAAPQEPTDQSPIDSLNRQITQQLNDLTTPESQA